MKKETSYSQKKEQVKHGWRVVDANGLVLGRLATKVADVLRGKDKPIFTPHVDCGDFVVVLNAEKVKLTGNKLNDKFYYDYTGFRGGMKKRSAAQMIENDPEEMIKLAVWGMLPKGPLGRQIVSKLKVYRGTEHPHQAQQPVAIA